MSRRDKYPRVGSTKRHKNITPQRPCLFKCGPAEFRLDIQEDWFRGNDSVVNVCKRHKEMAEQGEWKNWMTELDAALAKAEGKE